MKVIVTSMAVLTTDYWFTVSLFCTAQREMACAIYRLHTGSRKTARAEGLWLAVWTKFRRMLRHNDELQRPERNGRRGWWRCLRCGAARQMWKEVIFS